MAESSLFNAYGISEMKEEGMISKDYLSDRIH
jgi:hypothetical protein